MQLVTELMHLCLNKLESKVWKENCPNFLYTIYKAGGKSEPFPDSFLAVFPSLIKQQIFSNAYAFLVLSIWCLICKYQTCSQE